MLETLLWYKLSTCAALPELLRDTQQDPGMRNMGAGMKLRRLAVL